MIIKIQPSTHAPDQDTFIGAHFPAALPNLTGSARVSGLGSSPCNKQNTQHRQITTVIPLSLAIHKLANRTKNPSLIKERG